MAWNYEPFTVRSAAILTTSYVAGTVISNVAHNDQLMLYISFTIGSLTSLQLKIEFSYDGVTYYQETNGSGSGQTITQTLAEHTWAATGNYRIPVPIKDRYIKISAKGTGTVTNSSLTIIALTAQQQ